MKILIGTPVYDEQVTTIYHVSVMGLTAHFRAKRPEVSFDTLLPRQSIISRARNFLATRLLEDPSYTHLLFIDADMGFRPSLIEKMVAMDQPFVGCIYPKRQNNYERLLSLAARFDDPAEWRRFAASYVGGGHSLQLGKGLEVRGDFVRAKEAGAGLLLVRREVIEGMRERFPELWSEDPKGEYRAMGLAGGVFQPFESLQDETGIFCGEDVAFCRRWGGDVWLCFNEPVEHAGRETYSGLYEPRMRAGQL